MSLFTPDAVPGRPYWWDGVTWPDIVAQLPETADLLVIGAGYTGLSAAIAAHDAGARVVVIDSGRPGEGASTRNGGMLGAHPRLGWQTLAGRYGPQAADALFAEANEALEWVKSFLAAEQIDCGFRESGRIQLAYTRDQFEQQNSLAREVSEKGGVPCQVLSRDEVAREISTPLYKGAMLFPNHACLDPARYLLGMLNAALGRGIEVVPGCPAFKVVRVQQGQRVVTPQGSITAKKVVLATNGYTGVQFPWHHRRVFPVPSFILATEPLPRDLISELAPGDRMMVETRAFHSYFRTSPDGRRILFGGRAALVDIRMTKAARRLHHRMAEIWPQLSDTRLSHIWTGNTGFSFDYMPHVGERDGLCYAMGFSGGGTVLAPWLGRKAALRALDDPDGATAFSETKLTSRWFYRGGRPRFLTAANLFYRHWIDRKEDRAARL